MKFEDFKKLKTKINEKNFFNNYRGFSKLSHLLSYVGNGFSILFAYFFIFEVIISTVSEPSPAVEKLVMVISVIILTTLELMKRFVFDKFTQLGIKEKFTFKEKESVILGFICAGLIATSFYFSIHGAEKYADKKDSIKQSVDVQVNAFSDSLNKKYENKIVDLENQNKTLFETNQGYEARLSTLSAQYNDGTLSNSELRRVKNEMSQIRKDRELNTQLIEKNESKIKEVKGEKESEITRFETKKSQNADKKIEDTSSNPLIFLIFSTVIEFLILFGIWFINYYEIRSVEEYERLINKDPKYKAYNNWTEFINIIFKQDCRIGDVLPYKAEMLKVFKSNNIDMNNKEYDDLIKVFVHLGILKSKGNKKAIAINKEDAMELIKSHLKVD
jgi:hypothetical protein